MKARAGVVTRIVTIDEGRQSAVIEFNGVEPRTHISVPVHVLPANIGVGDTVVIECGSIRTQISQLMRSLQRKR